MSQLHADRILAPLLVIVYTALDDLGDAQFFESRAAQFCHQLPNARCDLVQVEPLLAGLAALSGAGFTLEASLSGARVRVRVAEGVADPEAQIERVLRATGVEVGEITPAAATLEDVFVSLVGESEAAA